MKEEKRVISIDAVLKRTLVQMKYEEIGSWLVTHNTPLFYAHSKGFSVIDKKYIDEHPKLKKMLDDTIKDIKKRSEKMLNSKNKGKKDSSYFG